MKKQMLKIGVAFSAMLLLLSSCLDTDYTPVDYDQLLTDNLSKVDVVQLTNDKNAIDKMLTDSADVWGIDPVDVQIEPRGGVRYIIHTPGAGDKPRVKDGVKMNYKVLLMSNIGGIDGTPFDDGDGLESYVFGLILGMQTTLPLLPKGTEATLFIPSGLAYGKNEIRDGNGDIIIPKDSNLIFKLTLTEVYVTPE
jgi:hypothetical protein